MHKSTLEMLTWQLKKARCVAETLNADTQFKIADRIMGNDTIMDEDTALVNLLDAIIQEAKIADSEETDESE